MWSGAELQKILPIKLDIALRQAGLYIALSKGLWVLEICTHEQKSLLDIALSQEGYRIRKIYKTPTSEKEG